MAAPKKGSMYVYTFENPKPTADTKKLISFRGWPGLRRSKTYREKHGGGGRVAEGDDVAAEKVIAAVAARKSVSLVESRKSACNTEVNAESTARKSVSLVESRKSVCNVEVNAESAARKSVSLVESRKSVCNIEVNAESAARLLQVKVMVSDMPGFMQLHAFRCARTTYDCLETFSSKHLAYNIKKEFDKVYGPAWHCIVGSGFGSFVTHSTGCFLYFSMEKLYILVFKTKIQKALHI